jgi:hypothetical protein
MCWLLLQCVVLLSFMYINHVHAKCDKVRFNYFIKIRNIDINFDINLKCSIYIFLDFQEKQTVVKIVTIDRCRNLICEMINNVNEQLRG